MSAFGVVVYLCCLSAVTSAEAEERFPYKSQVGAEGAVVHSGPGPENYATGELPPGEQVEVWRRHPDGWLAIRPPKASFSLVAASALRRTEGTDVAEVVDDRTAAWVGSSVPRSESLGWQVQLHAGEKVVVLGREKRALRKGAAAESVCRIAPPAGEFRWIRAEDLQDRPDPTKATRDEAVQLAEYRIDANPDKEPSKRSVRDLFVARKQQNQSNPRPATSSPAVRSAFIPARSSTTPAASSGGTLEQLEVQLSSMVSRPVETWDLASLRQEAQRHIDRGKTTLDRARAQRFLEQIEEFAALRGRFESLDSPSDSPSDPLAATSDGEAGPETESTVTEETLDPRFDGTGWLLPVHSSRRIGPPYALLDQEGRVLQFVSPAPGLNLHRYLRKEIGVFGQRSYVPSLDKPHVTAQRVVELDRHRR